MAGMGKDGQREVPVSDFDIIVVGAGPAGSTAALVAARAAKSVCLIERGPFPGAKNMYGGVIYGRVLDALIPQWWETAPVQRWVTRRATVMMTPTQSLTLDYRSARWGEAPYNGATAFRPDFDAWLADHAVAAGATLVCSTTVVGLIRDGTGKVTGVRTDRPDGDLTAEVVIACDGVNSFIAKEAGLYPGADDTSHFTLGAKEVLSLPRELIEDRFGLTGDEGADFEIIGCTGDIAGGGFIYTNLESIAVGVVLRLSDLAESDHRAEELIAGLKAHPMVAPLVKGAVLKEYSAHLIPEGGYDMMPTLGAPGLLVSGDAAAFCLGAGLWLEGVNFAIGGGQAAAQAAVAGLGRPGALPKSVGSGARSIPGHEDSILADYRRRLEATFVLADHKNLRRAPELVLSDRVQFRYPQLVCDLLEAAFQVDNPEPKPGLVRLARRTTRANGVKVRHLIRDGWRAMRTYG